MRRVFGVLFILAGAYVVFQGVKDVDTAHSWLEFIRGLFWIVIGSSSFWNGSSMIKEKP